MRKDNIIGLIGGMGPYASAYFYTLLLDKSGREFGAKNNDDYPEIVIDSVPVPDFISDTKQLNTACTMLVSRIKRLNEFGCTSISMVCNTGHLLYPKLIETTHVRLISLIDLVREKAKTLRMKKVGVFATETTIKSKLYDEAFTHSGIQIVLPDLKIQKIQDAIIRDVIARGDTHKYEDVLREETQKFIKEKQLDGVILGCTELPLVFPKNTFNNVIDCLDVLADSLLTKYYNEKPMKE